MTGPADWIEALNDSGRAAARILFARLGLVARCRALASDELAECMEVGGEKGARYAIYLSCAELREAGEQLRLRGEILSPFDITRGIPYADAIAAAGMIVRLSGGSEAMVRMLEDEESDAEAIFRGMEGQSRAIAEEYAQGNPFAAHVPVWDEPEAVDSRFFGLRENEPGSVAGDGEIDSGTGPEDGAEAHLTEASAEWVFGDTLSSGRADLRRVALDTAKGGPRPVSGSGAAVSHWGGGTVSSAAGLNTVGGGNIGLAGNMASRHGFASAGDDTDRLARLLADRLIDAAGNI